MNWTTNVLRLAPALLAFAVVPGRSAGQVVGTQCWNSNGVLQCNSQAGILYTPPSGAEAFAQNFIRAFTQARALRRLREQQAELENGAQLARQRQAAGEAAAADREAAAQRLFLERVTAVIQHIADSLRIFGEEGRRLLEASGPSIVDLYKVNPLPTRDQIMEVLWPYLQKLNNDFTAFIVRVAPPNKPAVDSLGLHQDELQLLIQALGPVTQDAFMLNPDGSPSDYRAAVEPLLKRARVYFDSTRAAARPRIIVPLTRQSIQPLVDSTMATALATDWKIELSAAIDSIRLLRARHAGARLSALCARVGCLNIYAAHGVRSTVP